MSRVMLTLVALTAIASAAPADEKPAGAGTVQGQVILSPVCPGPARKDAGGDCAARPLQTTVDVFSAANSTRASASVMTDTSGWFQIKLAPGRYILVARPPLPGATGKPAEVIVGAATVADVKLTVDSGLR